MPSKVRVVLFAADRTLWGGRAILKLEETFVRAKGSVLTGHHVQDPPAGATSHERAMFIYNQLGGRHAFGALVVLRERKHARGDRPYVRMMRDWGVGTMRLTKRQQAAARAAVGALGLAGPRPPQREPMRFVRTARWATNPQQPVPTPNIPIPVDEEFDPHE